MSTPDRQREDLLNDEWIEAWKEDNYRHLREVVEPDFGIDAYLDELEAVTEKPWHDAS